MKENFYTGHFKYVSILFLFNLFIFFSNNPVYCQSYHVRTYMEDEGLPSSAVFDITQDTSGCMWFATRKGISVYDGARWKTYTDRDGLPPAEYSKIKCDGRGTIWALSIASNLTVYFNGHRWFLLPKPVFPAIPRERGFITSFELAEINGQRETVVGLGTRGSGLFLWTDKNMKWENIDLQKGLISSSINDIAAYGECFYIAADRGVSVITLRPGNNHAIDNSINKRINLPSPEVVAIAVEEKNKTALSPGQDIILWLLGKDWAGYLEDGVFKVITNSIDLRHDEFGFFLQPDNRGGLFGGNRYGIYHVDKGGSVSKFGEKQGLMAGGATGAYIDREKNIWFSTFRGAGKISGMRFANYRQLHGLLSDETTAAWEIEPGHMVFGHNNGITFYKDRQFYPRVLSREDINKNLYPRVLDIRGDQKGNIWAAASDLGLARINKGNTIRWYSIEEGLPGQVTSVLPDKFGNLWAATSTGAFLLRGGKFVKISPDYENEPCYVRRLFRGPGPGDFIYAATISRGIYSIDVKKNQWKPFWQSKNKFANNVFSLLFSRRGKIWAGTKDGLYTGKNGTLEKFVRKGFQLNRPVYFIVEDDENRLWFGTGNGVIKWDEQDWKEYTLHKGLAGRETNRAAGLVDHRGRVWIGTDRGLSCYREEFEKKDVPPPLVQLLSLSLDASDTQMSLQRVNKLKYHMNNLVFHFRAISFIDENAVRFQSKLEGFDRAWSAESALDKGQIRYTNLSPGRYRFLLKAGNAEGLWSDVVSSAEIIIRRPFWKEWWFYVLLLLISGLVFYSILVYFSKRHYASLLERRVHEKTEELRKYQHHLEEMVEQRTVELTNSNVRLKKEIDERMQAEEKIGASLKEKEVLLKEIHHRVKNNLQIISSLLNLQSGYIEDKNALKLFENSRERIFAMALIHEKLYESGDLSRIDFPGYIRSLTTHLLDTYSLSPGRVRLKMQIEDVALDIDTSIPLGLIISELVSNALKYAFPDRREGELRVILEKSTAEEYDYTLIIDDNGIGFPASLDFRTGGSLGMMLVNSLVKKLRGVIDLERNNGTKFTIKFKKVTPG